jgi:hypothetical protein
MTSIDKLASVADSAMEDSPFSIAEFLDWSIGLYVEGVLNSWEKRCREQGIEYDEGEKRFIHAKIEDDVWRELKKR